MYLKLFKHPHVEPYQLGTVRLLFEGGVPMQNDLAAGSDFYLYVWIQEGKKVSGFQAVLQDSITLVFRKPDYVTVGHVTRDPMNRAVSQTVSQQEQSLIHGVVTDLQNEEFPHLLKKVEKIAAGGVVENLELVEAEQDALAQFIDDAGNS